MTPGIGKMSDEAAIRLLIDERIESVRGRDVDSLMSGYATDVATFDMIAPLANLGSEAVRQRVVEWFASFESPLGYEIEELKLDLSGEVAFDHHLTHVHGVSKSGDKVDMWFRETIGYRKLEGHWKVVHQHSSVPFDMTTGRALLELIP